MYVQFETFSVPDLRDRRKSQRRKHSITSSATTAPTMTPMSVLVEIFVELCLARLVTEEAGTEPVGEFVDEVFAKVV